MKCDDENLFFFSFPVYDMFLEGGCRIHMREGDREQIRMLGMVLGKI